MIKFAATIQAGSSPGKGGGGMGSRICRVGAPPPPVGPGPRLLGTQCRPPPPPPPAQLRRTKDQGDVVEGSTCRVQVFLFLSGCCPTLASVHHPAASQ